MKNNRFVTLDISVSENEEDWKYGNNQFWITIPSAGYSLKEFETIRDRQDYTLQPKERNKYLFTISTNVDQEF